MSVCVPDKEDGSKNLSAGFPSVSHCLWVAQKESVYHMFALSHLPVNRRLSCEIPDPCPPCPLSRMAYKPQLSDVSYDGLISYDSTDVYP